VRGANEKGMSSAFLARSAFSTAGLAPSAQMKSRQPPPPAPQGLPPSAPAAPAAPAPIQPVQIAVPTPPASGQAAQAAPAAQVVPAVGQNPAVAVYQQNGASVVNITSLAVVRTLQGSATQPQGIGSGFLLDRAGRIVTNNHVVADANELSVTFQDKTSVPATLVGRDPDNDLAVIQVDPTTTDEQGQPLASRLQPVTLGDSAQVQIGETVIAIGSPLGLQQTVTEGIVSALRNPGEESAQGQLDLLGGAIQTDASINPGNSGGPLFNAAGQVIGVNSAILSQSGGNEGIGFAIPVNVVKRVTPELIQAGRYRHPQVGVTTISLSEIGQATKQQLGIDPKQKGLLVQSVTAGAQQAGIQGGTRTVRAGSEQLAVGGDILVAVDGQPLATTGDLRGYIENNKHPGDTVSVTFVRNGQRQDVQVTLSERPAQQP
jgi:S1-C subfamily serine protease